MNTYTFSVGFSDGASGKESACQGGRHRRCGFSSWVWKIPWWRKCQPTPVFLLGESHGQRSLLGYSPWGHKESDTTEVTKACTVDYLKLFMFQKRFFIHYVSL